MLLSMRRGVLFSLIVPDPVFTLQLVIPSISIMHNLIQLSHLKHKIRDLAFILPTLNEAFRFSIQALNNRFGSFPSKLQDHLVGRLKGSLQFQYDRPCKIK